MLSDFLQFVWAIVSHWQVLVTGGVVTAFVSVYEHRSGEALSWHVYRWVLVVFVIIAVFLAWREEHVRSSSLGNENVALKTETEILRGRISDLEKRPIVLQSPLVVPSSGPNATDRLKQRLQQQADAAIRTARDQLSRFVEEGIRLRNQWVSQLAVSSDAQLQTAAAITAWHAQVKNYLAKPPLGLSYAVRFDSQTKGGSGLPIGIATAVAGVWQMLESDLATLGEFLADPNLGK
jgi:hypothetical protein